MNIPRLPSKESIRQRLDLLEHTYKEYIPVDMDVSPMDNSNTKKKSVSCTYKLHDGYAPKFMYLGAEGIHAGM